VRRRLRALTGGGAPLLASVDDVVPGEAGRDPHHSEDDCTGYHVGAYDTGRSGEVPLRWDVAAAKGVSTSAVAGEFDHGGERLRQLPMAIAPGTVRTVPYGPPEGAPIPPPRRRKGGGGKKRREPLTPVVKEDTLSLVGRVIETFPSSTFKVELENGHTILASLAGRLRRFRIRITPGDDVDVELSPYDLTRGRITYRRQGRNA
jgi:translation initiation factor IF-1